MDLGFSICIVVGVQGWPIYFNIDTIGIYSCTMTNMEPTSTSSSYDMML